MLAPKLSKGDTIGVFSASSPATATASRRFARACTFLHGHGFRILPGRLTGMQDGYRSGSIQQRADELNTLLRNPEVRCVMSAIGGNNSNALLPYIDYDALKKDPKIIIGYSDTTALLLGIYQQTGLVPFYGPAAVASFGELPPFVDQTYVYFAQALMHTPQPPFRLPTPTQWTEEFLPWEEQEKAKISRPNKLLTLSAGSVEGRLIGGNLNTMAGIWGSPYMPTIKQGDILFIEDSLKDAATVERSFAHLKLNGVFDRIGGLILGKHELFDDCGTGRRPHDILQEVVGEFSIPVLAELDCCHTHPMLTLPLGIYARLDATAQTLTLLEPWVH